MPEIKTKIKPRFTPISQTFVRTTRQWHIEQDQDEEMVEDYVNEAYNNLK